MFYLIDEKDGLKSEAILINVKNLKFMETMTQRKSSEVSVAFHFSEDECARFSFDKDSCFNVNDVMRKMEDLEDVTYKSNVICLTDSQNVLSLQNEQFYLHKFSNILMNLDSIQIVYFLHGHFKVITKERNVQVKESPLDIYRPTTIPTAVSIIQP